MGPTWSYAITSAPQTNLGNRTTAVMVGNLVGGSSAINAMMTVRATSDDYDRWGSFFGEKSDWSWEGLLPYFKRVRLSFAFIFPFACNPYICFAGREWLRNDKEDE